MSLFTEIKRRNVLRVGIAYAVVAWLLLQVSATLVPALLLPAWLHSGVALLLILGFPVALLFAWAYELTPQGEMKDEDSSASQLTTGIGARKLDFVIIGLLVIAVGYFAADKFVLDPSDYSEPIQASVAELSTNPSQERESSIAVLPFVNMSDDPNNEYFSDGLSEELLNLLAKIPELRVSARTSSFSFKDQVLEIPAIAERLNVAHVLEGSVRKSGNTVRITAQLIDGRTDTHLWSETYDRTLDDIFAIQDEIAADVVAQLKLTLLGSIPRSRTTDPEAYRLYMQAVHMIDQLDSSKNAEAELIMRRALQLDSEFVPALRELSRLLWRRIGSGPNLEADVANTLDLLERAIAIDPNDAATLAYLGWNYTDFDGDIDRGARLFEKALSIEPTNEHVIRTAALFAHAFGRPEDAVAISKFGVARNPLCYPCYMQLVTSYIRNGQFDKAESAEHEIESIFDKEPDQLGMILLLNNRPEEALAVFVDKPNQTDRLFSTALALHDLGRADEARIALDDFIAFVEDKPYWAWGVAMAYARTNQLDAAFDALERAASRSQIGVSGHIVRWNLQNISSNARSPLFRGLHDDPRWHEFLDRYGISAEHLAAVNFRVSLPDR